MINTAATFELAVGDELLLTWGIDPSSPLHAGHVRSISPGASVRDSTVETAQADGAQISDQLLGAMSAVFNLDLLEGDPDVRARKWRRIVAAWDRLRREPGTLTWTEGTDPTRWQLRDVRAGEYPAKSDQDGPPKQVQFQLKTGTPLVVTEQVQVSEGVPGYLHTWNEGEADAPLVIYVFGPVGPTGFSIVDEDTGEALAVTAPIADGEHVVIDCADKSVLLNSVDSLYSALDYTNATYLTVPPGGRKLRFTADAPGANTRCRLEWRSARRG